MVKLFLFFLLSYFCVAIINAQNIVPNPCFSDTVGNHCPDDQSNGVDDEVAIAKGWSSFGATPDYYNSCGTMAWGVPSNSVGYQIAECGNAYCGFITYYDSTQIKNYRELIGAELTSPLIAGSKYSAILKVCLADSSRYATNNISISFSTVRYMTLNSAPINNHAIVRDTSVITETNTWTTISGSFIADSNYTYVIVGNFFQDDSTIVVSAVKQIPSPSAYYLVGYVSVMLDTSTGINNVIANTNISIYPNPSSGIFHISFPEKITAVQVFDVEGRMVMENNSGPINNNDTVINLEGKAKGVYFLRATTVDGIINGKLVVE